VVRRYGPIEGLPALREALLKKCRERNGIEGKEIHITCGGNQGNPTLRSSFLLTIPPTRSAELVERSRESSLALSLRERAFLMFVRLCVGATSVHERGDDDLRCGG
jgi:hypothetical protein